MESKLVVFDSIRNFLWTLRQSLRNKSLLFGKRRNPTCDAKSTSDQIILATSSIMLPLLRIQPFLQDPDATFQNKSTVGPDF